MSNIVVIGTGEFTIKTAQAVQAAGEHLGAIISMPSNCLPLNSADIKSFANSNRISYFEFEDLNAPEAIAVLLKISPDYILSSWPKILKKEVLGIPKRFVIGSHPTELPYNRGRHPLHWLIAQGIFHTALSFFQMDDGVDTGKILHKIPIEINKGDTIVDLLNKVNIAGYRGTMELLKILALQPGFEGTQQDHGKANYWRKRTPHDVILDLRLPAGYLLRTIFSFTLPYPCAELIFEKHIIKIVSATIVQGVYSQEELLRMEPGKIIKVSGRTIQVKAGDEVIELISNGPLPEGMDKVRYIHPPTKYLSEMKYGQ